MKLLTLIDGRQCLIEIPALSVNFSYKKVETSESIVIPENQQMLLRGDITIDGDLTVDGELWLL